MTAGGVSLCLFLQRFHPRHEALRAVGLFRTVQGRGPLPERIHPEALPFMESWRKRRVLSYIRSSVIFYIVRIA